jgi:hypothetical protein
MEQNPLLEGSVHPSLARKTMNLKGVESFLFAENKG